MPHLITKAVEFCYGHRVWSQTLDSEFASDLLCACRHLHGHEGKVDVTLTSLLGGIELRNGMVTDFRHLEWLKTFLNQIIDHHFIIDVNDPLMQSLLNMPGHPDAILYPWKIERTDVANSPNSGGMYSQMVVGRRIMLPPELPIHMREYLESFFIVDFVPTSENLSKWMFDIVAWKMQRLCRVASVDWWETPKSHSLYVQE